MGGGGHILCCEPTSGWDCLGLGPASPAQDEASVRIFFIVPWVNPSLSGKISLSMFTGIVEAVGSGCSDLSPTPERLC